MRNGIVNGSSPLSEILGILTGTWNEYDDREWHVVKTPFFVALTATLEAGPQMLPVTPNRTGLLQWANANGAGSLPLKAKEKNFELPQNAVVQTILWGTTGEQ